MSVPTQETFDRIVEHLRNQGEKSLDKRHSCVYRGTGGRSCSVGCLIPDSKYNQSLEGQPASSVTVSSILRELGHDVRLCDSLQKVHDLRDVTQWEEGFEQVAVAYNLVYEKPLKQEIVSDVHA